MTETELAKAFLSDQICDTCKTFKNKGACMIFTPYGPTGTLLWKKMEARGTCEHWREKEIRPGDFE